MIKSDAIMEIRRNHSKSLDIQSKITDNSNRAKYTLKRKPIGKGSFATVYYATDVNMTEYAIKRISIEKLDQTRIDKFVMELEISSKMEHENIVKCYEIFKTSSDWSIVSEYCNYGTFSDLISELNKLTDYKQKENLGFYYLCQLKNALKYLNVNNIIHRDLKPMNILMTKDKKLDEEVIVKLADFGFARYFNDIYNKTENEDMISTICGSPIYMAPELLIDMKYNLKADLWSFGVIMYELLYGKNPYNCPKNISHLKDLIMKQEIKFPEYYSNNCVDLMKKILQTNPDDRISWIDFFDHSWFRNMPFPPDEKVDDDQIFEFDDDSNDERQEQPIKSLNAFNYIENYVDKNERSNIVNSDREITMMESTGSNIRSSTSDPSVKTYKESYAGSVVKILYDSVGYIFGQGRSI